MAASLMTLDAIVEVDGTIRLRDAVRLAAPATAVVTILVEDDRTNDATRRAIEESVDGLPRFNGVDALFQDLHS